MYRLTDVSKLNPNLLDQSLLNAKPITISVEHGIGRGGGEWVDRGGAAAAAVSSTSSAITALVPGNGNGFKWSGVNAHPTVPNRSGNQVFGEPTSKPSRRFHLNFATSSAVVLGSAICLWILLFALIGALYFNVHQSTTAFKEELRPKLAAALEHASSVLAHLDRAAVNADHILSDANSLEHSVLPSISHAVNDSTAILHKLETISRNPVLKVSLGE